MDHIPCLVYQTDNSSKYCTYLLHYDSLPSVRTKDFPKTIVPTYAKVVNFLTTAIFATVTIFTYFNIKFLIIVINVINRQLNNIVYRPVFTHRQYDCTSLCTTLVCAVPLKLGVTAEKWGEHSKKKIPALGAGIRAPHFQFASGASAANILMLVLIQSGMSLTNSKKRRGPSTDPCGTPLTTTVQEEY